MIGWLKGNVKEVFADRIILDTGGVGYEVHVPVHLLAEMTRNPKDRSLYIYTHIREDILQLFGFSSLQERQLFLTLHSVNGVGAKTALGLLSAFPSERLVRAIQDGDAGLLKQAPGIGKKTAERIVLDLRDKLKSFLVPGTRSASVTEIGKPSLQHDLVSALENLGYKRLQVESAISSIDLSKFESFDRMLKETLKVLSR